MRIELEIPDELIEEGRAIHIMAGNERLAYKPWDQSWHIKYSRCSMCGKCCKHLECAYLGTDNLCKAPVDRPFICCITEPRKKTVSTCTSLYYNTEEI